MNSQGSSFEIVGVPLGEQLDHMLKIAQTVVDRCCRQHEQRLPIGDIEEAPIPRRRDVSLAANSRDEFPATSDPWISEVMGLVDNDYVSEFPHPFKAFWEFVASAEVGVIENH